jgi:hypothetical protein
MEEKAWTIVMSEQDPAGVDDPAFAAMFDKLGHALVVHVTESGSIFGTQVCHQSLGRKGFSTSGTIKIDGFSVTSGQLQAHIFTDGPQTFFDDTWSLDLTLTAPLPTK